MLRFETGLRSYQTWMGGWGLCILRESMSYILDKPYGTGDVTATIIGAPGSFSVVSFTRAQNMLSPEIDLFFKAKNDTFFSLSYEGEFTIDSTYRYQQVMGKIGVFF